MKFLRLPFIINNNIIYEHSSPLYDGSTWHPNARPRFNSKHRANGREGGESSSPPNTQNKKKKKKSIVGIWQDGLRAIRLSRSVPAITHAGKINQGAPLICTYTYSLYARWRISTYYTLLFIYTRAVTIIPSSSSSSSCVCYRIALYTWYQLGFYVCGCVGRFSFHGFKKKKKWLVVYDGPRGGFGDESRGMKTHTARRTYNNNICLSVPRMSSRTSAAAGRANTVSRRPILLLLLFYIRVYRRGICACGWSRAGIWRERLLA